MHVCNAIVCVLAMGALVFGACAPAVAQALPHSGGERLSADAFAEPPRIARPRAYWDWLNGNVDLEQLTNDLEEMKDKGMGGAQMWDVGAHRNPDNFIPAGPEFLGPDSVAAMRHALAEARRLGLELGLMTASGWNAGGAWVKPEHAGKHAFVSETLAEGPGLVETELPMPELPEACPKNEDGTPVYLREIAVLAVPDSADMTIADRNDVRDISRHYSNGVLRWNAPAGHWRILRFICTNHGQQLYVSSPNSGGPMLDFLDPEATTEYLRYILERIAGSPEQAADLGLSWLQFESMELAQGIQWSGGFAEDFERHAGYSPIGWLPVLSGWTIESEDVTEQFMYDYRKAISDQLIFSHYTTAREFLNRYGMYLIAEAGGPGPPIWPTCPVDALKALGNVDVPQGEFWIRHLNMFLIKEISSASHIYGRRITDAESFTTWRRWKDGPAVLKRYADRAFCEGLNRITLHTFAHSPIEAGFPGRSYHAGVDLNPRVTWWEHARPFMDYLSRCSYMLQQGLFVADVIHFYGDQAPNFWPEYHDVPEKPLLDGLGRGYDYDVVNSDVLLNRMDVADGRIVLPDGMSYAMLSLRAQAHMPVEVLEKIGELVRGGATVVGPKPEYDPRLLDQDARTNRLRELADEIWGPSDGESVTVHRYGEGRVIWGRTPREVLQSDAVGPDFTYASLRGGNPALDYIHRRDGERDIYFVRNPSAQEASAMCTFRVFDKAPSFWDPLDGSVRSAHVFQSVSGGTRMPITLAPGGAIFVVFGPAEDRVHATSITLEGAAIPADLTHLSPEDGEWLGWSNGEYEVRLSTGGTLSARVDGLPVPVELGGEWRLHFDEEWGGPPEVQLFGLYSWTEHEDDGVRYYSGTGTYRKSFEIPPELLRDGLRIHLDLGEVRDIAVVRLNGQDLGVLWTPPCRVDITEAATPGGNTLEVEVTNMWANRLAGDLHLPPEERFTRTNDVPRTRPLGGDELWRAEPSGLLGPVRLVPAALVRAQR